MNGLKFQFNTRRKTKQSGFSSFAGQPKVEDWCCSFKWAASNRHGGSGKASSAIDAKMSFRVGRQHLLGSLGISMQSMTVMGMEDLSRHQRSVDLFLLFCKLFSHPNKMIPRNVMMTILVTMMIKSQRRLWSWGLTNVLDSICIYSQAEIPMPNNIWHIFW